MNLKKNLLTIAIASSLAACGGGGGSSASSSGTVGGSVVKGLVVGGKATAKDATGSVVGTATTDANGEYSIVLDPAYTGGPLQIEIEGQPGATMKCDVVGGCDPDKNPATTNVLFGETFPLTSKFKLKAVVADATGTVSTHVTALTDMAAKLAEKNSGTGNPLSTDAINGANSQVAQLFGLSNGDDLISQKPIDITNPTAIATATSAAQLRNALYSAAILGAVLKSTSGSDDIGDDLDAFSNLFADDGGQLRANDSDTTRTSLSEVLFEADTLLKDNSVSGAIASVDDSIGAKVTADKADADSKPVDSPTTSNPSPEAASSDVRQALAMISDLRDLAYALGARQNNTASTDAQALIGNADAFANELSIAGDATGPGAQYLVKALGMAAAAMAQAGAVYADAVEQELDPPAIVEVNGIQVTITPNVDNPLDITLTVAETALNVDPTYTGTDAINQVDLSLSFALALTGVQEIIDSLTLTQGTDSSGNPTTQESATGTLTLNANLAGTVTGPTAMLSILNSDAKPSSVSVTVQQLTFSDLSTELSSGERFAGSWGIQPSSISLDLNAKLEQRAVTPAAMFEGDLSVSLTGFDYDGTEDDEWSVTDTGINYTETNSYTLSETLSFTALNMTLDGRFSRGDDSFAALFNATVGGSGFSATFEENDDWSTTYDAEGNWLSNSGAGFTSDSTTTGFVTLDAMLRFEAIINGISNSYVMVQLDLDRSTETTGSAGLRITQGAAGKYLDITTQLAKGADLENPDDIVPTSAVLTNQDGISINLLEADATGTGTITKGSGESLKQLGTVTEESGTVIFRLKDGSTNRIESL